MCISPVTIPNPSLSRQQFSLVGEGVRILDQSLSSKELFITVPCGTCVECRNTYYNSILQRAIVESLSSYIYFVTLTYDNRHIPSVTLPNGKIVYFTDYTHIQNLFKRFRKNNVLDRDFRYLVALEYGDKRHRPHAHILLFVSRLQSDDKSTPYFIEKLLFDKIKLYFADNVGTRKHPVYDCLFTYRHRYTPKGVKTNYFVKYVEQDLPDYSFVQSDTTTTIKTIRYLIGYVSKGSAFDATIKKYLQDIHDEHLRYKLELLLRSKIRYSKGFGLGFTDAFKNEQKRTYVKVSQLSALYNGDFPVTFSGFADLYPDLIPQIRNFIVRSRELFCNDTLKKCVQEFNEEDIFIYVIILRYFPNFITHIYKSQFRVLSNDNVSYLFKYLDRYRYIFPKISVDYVYDNYVSKYIRAGIEQGFNARVPFLAFPLYSSNSFMPLCKFYKERYSDDTDIITLYNILGVSNFDEWQAQFIDYITLSKNKYPTGNIITHDSEILPQFVEKPQKNVKNLYEYLFVNKR